jgi:murein L,D-transpeptidase YafK
VEPNIPDKETVTKRAQALEEQIGLPADEAWIWIDKSERLMVVNNGRGYREAFHIALGEAPEGDKAVEGDGRTPEGEFHVCRRVTNERFQRFLALSYPGRADARRGRRQRILRPVEYRSLIEQRRRNECPPWDTALGGNIGIHGYGERTEYGLRHALGQDWTEGCIGVNNDEIDRIYNHTRTGTRVLIVP